MSITGAAALHALADLCDRLRNMSSKNPWIAFEHACSTLLDSIPFTVLAFDGRRALLTSLHSNRVDVGPAGGAKRVTDSTWVTQVRRRGSFYLASSKEQLQPVFSEHETLCAIGCESLLNIPMCNQGRAVGSLNVLGAAGRFDDFNAAVARILTRLALPYLLAALDGIDRDPRVADDLSKLESV